jgi:cytochrome bd ubiquinol oxidase subunit I
VEDPRQATAAQIDRAAWSTVPDVPVLFWSFRIMVGLGFFFIALFATLFVIVSKRRIEQHRGLLRLAVWCLPLPWIAAEVGWVVAEYGRQPWVIEGILPTFMGVSSVTTAQVATSLISFVLFYSGLAVVELFLMFRIARGGPDGWFRPNAESSSATHRA